MVVNDLMQNVMNFNDVAIVSVKGSNYRIYFWYMSKDDAINIMKTSNLNEKKNRETMLNRAKENWENDKQIKRLRELARISKNIKETIAKLKNENKEFWTLFYII